MDATRNRDIAFIVFLQNEHGVQHGRITTDTHEQEVTLHAEDLKFWPGQRAPARRVADKKRARPGGRTRRKATRGVPEEEETRRFGVVAQSPPWAKSG
jgi:hypothetical protein